jgi:hypothetical protein
MPGNAFPCKRNKRQTAQLPRRLSCVELMPRHVEAPGRGRAEGSFCGFTGFNHTAAAAMGTTASAYGSAGCVDWRSTEAAERDPRYRISDIHTSDGAALDVAVLKRHSAELLCSWAKRAAQCAQCRSSVGAETSAAIDRIRTRVSLKRRSGMRRMRSARFPTHGEYIAEPNQNPQPLRARPY